MSKITIRLSIAAAVALLSSGAAMAQGTDFASIVIDYGRAPGLSAQAPAVAAKPAGKVVVAQAAVSNADAELGFFVPAARKAPAATMLAGQVAKTAQ